VRDDGRDAHECDTYDAEDKCLYRQVYSERGWDDERCNEKSPNDEECVYDTCLPPITATFDEKRAGPENGATSEAEDTDKDDAKTRRARREVKRTRRQDGADEDDD
jgi:hypothetical protein